MILLTSLYLLSSIIYAIIGISIIINNYKSKLNRIFFFGCMNISLWAFTYTIINNVTDVNTAIMFRNLSAFFWGSFFSIMLHFFIVLCNKQELLKNPLSYFLLYLPSALVIYFYAFLQPVTVDEAISINLGWVFVNTDRGVLYNYFQPIYTILFLILSVILLLNWCKNTPIKREQYQGKIIMVSLVIVTMVGTITDILFPILRITLIPSMAVILMLIPIFGIWYSIKKYRLMSISPQNVLLGVLHTMGEGLLVIDSYNKIVTANDGALKLLDYKESEVMNHNVDLIFPEDTIISLDSDCSSLEIDLLKRDNNSLPVLFSSSTLKDEWGDKLGTVIIFQDTSEIKRYQDELKDAYEELEYRVHNRTIELKKANEELENEIEKRIQMEDEIRNLAFNDHLTGLPNKRLFNDKLKREILRSEDAKGSLAVLFLDLDLFKMVNDTFGHTWGDELLKLLALRLKAIVSEYDTLARVGGDEFLILLQNFKNKTYVQAVAERILEAIRQPFKFNSHDIFITGSIGITLYPNDGKDAETLIKNADIAMYKSKDLGKNKYQFCDYLMKSTAYEEMKLTNFLYRAIEKDELELYYQPQVNTDTGEIIGMEALLRWYHGELGFISPRYFIPIAEKTGLIVSIGEWVLRTACKQNKEWQDRGIINVPVAVNLSANQFTNNKVVDQIKSILGETKLDPKFLELEVTERIFMKKNEDVINTLDQLKKIGVTISIDDFGTEYSSLNYLKTLPLDKLKIAMEFISGINKNEKDEAIISVIITLCKNLRLKVIAEGVETADQAEFLRKNQCDEIQGYYFYKPMPVSDIEELMNDLSTIKSYKNNKLESVYNA